MPSFLHRSMLPELMDQPGVREGDIAQTLRELEIVGRILGGYTVTLDGLQKIMAKNEVTSILDIGFGGGDTLRAVAGWARRRRIPLKLAGIDMNPFMKQYAAAQSAAFPELQYRIANVFDAVLLDESPDVVMSSLFCHHFDDELLIKLLQRKVQMCRIAVLVNDLHRHPVAYYSIKAISRIFSRSVLFRYDAPLSVAKAFTRKDWLRILSAAGISRYSLQWRWAWRWQLIIPKQEIILNAHGA